MKASKAGALFIFSGLVVAGVLIKTRPTQISRIKWSSKGYQNAISKEQLAQALGDSASFYRFPSDLKVTLNGEEIQANVAYTFEPELQEAMENLFKTYHPDYGAFVAVDATTGRILSMVSYSRHNVQQNLTIRSTFPSASIFKVVTAAAALETGKYSPDTVIPFDGRNHTLYRGNILKTRYNRWTRYITLKEAFARSINTVFGKIGAFTLGPSELREYADRFGFNRTIASDIPVQPGYAYIPDDPWGLAESASGFTRDNTMSPLQGSLIAAAIVNDGVMMEPYIVQSVIATNRGQLYQANPNVLSMTVDPKTAFEMRAMMHETVIRGTSQRSFRGFFRHRFSTLNVGGKTGSLTGKDPPGKYDWFVGYADGGSKKIAVSALTINEKFWTVKSSYIARKAIETYFKSFYKSDN